MDQLANQLLKAGLVSGERVAALEKVKREKTAKEFQKKFALTDLTFEQWKPAVRERLQKNPTLEELIMIIRETHDKFQANKSLRRIVKPLLQLRELLDEQNLPPEEIKRLARNLW